MSLSVVLCPVFLSFFFFFMPSVSKSAALYSQKLHLIQGTRACLLLISCPSPHACTDLNSQEIFHRGWTLSFPKEQIKRPKSACPHRVGIWQRFEVALRHHREWLQITLSAQSASKPFAGLSHPRERLHSASSMHNRAGPWQDGEELAIPYGPWFVASTWRGRNNDSITLLHPQTGPHYGHLSPLAPLTQNLILLCAAENGRKRTL